MNTIKNIFFLSILSLICILVFGMGTTDAKDNGQVFNPKAVEERNMVKPDLNFSNIPLYFISNQGQVNSQAKFYVKTSRYTLWLTKEGLVFDSTRKQENQKSKARNSQQIQNKKFQNSKPNFRHNRSKVYCYQRDVSRLIFINANKDLEIIPLNKTGYKVNYFIGKDKSKWFGNVPTSEAVLYKNIYKNIDLKVYGIEKQIEYDWIIRPGGNPADIKFQYRNVIGTAIDPEGHLLVDTRFGRIMHQRPMSYQERLTAKRINVEVTFKKISKNSYAFNVGDYDKKQDLIIDPVVLLYSTYLGGNGDDYGTCIATDGSGNVYVSGDTDSLDFPIQNQYQSYQTGTDVFVTKIDTTQIGAASLVYSTYLGGDANDFGIGIAIDGSGNACVTGQTNSTDFPTQYQYQLDQTDADAFVTVLSSGGDSLLYSTYLGGDDYDAGNGIDVDSSGFIYVIGETDSSDFPTVNQYQDQGNIGDSFEDVFVCRINPALSGNPSLLYSTYLGGDGFDYGYGIVEIAGIGEVLVTGSTDSTDFPTVNPLQINTNIDMDAFIARINTTLSGTASLLYSTYLGGSYDDFANAIDIDSSGSIYVTGATMSTDFPTTGSAYMQNYQGGVCDVFVSKLSPAGDSLVYSTYLGGSAGGFLFMIGYDIGYSIKVDTNGSAHVAGFTSSTDFPTVDAFQSTLQGGSTIDTFVVKLFPSGNSLIYSTYLGGNGFDSYEPGSSLALDNSGCVYVAGATDSSNFPCLNAYNNTFQGGIDAFVTRLGATPTVSTEAVSAITVTSAQSGGNVTDSGGLAVTARGVCWSTNPNPTIADNVTVDGSGIGSFTSSITGLSGATTYYVRAYATNSVGTGYGNEVTFSTDVTISGTVTDQTLPIQGVTITFSHDNHSEITDINGYYSYIVPFGTTTTIIPSHGAVTAWVPPWRALANITSNQPGQDFVATIIYTCTISGTITSGGSGLQNVTMTGLPGNPTTNAAGYYSATVPFGWSGTAIPSLPGYIFTPPLLTYTNVTSDQINQNYTALSGNPVISGTVRTSGGGGISGVTLTFSNGGGTATTDGSGYYFQTMTSGWSGTVTPNLAGYSFNPSNRAYSNVISDQSGQDYTGTSGNPVISGTVRTPGGIGIPGVTLYFSNGGGPVISNASGNYSHTISPGWSGTVTPSLAGYTFIPVSLSYTNVISNQANQNYIGISTANPVISGTVWTLAGDALPAVTLTFSNNGGSSTTAANGIYSHTVPSGWSGTVTPAREGYEFIPGSRTYTNVTSSQSHDDFISISTSTSPEININRTQLNFGANQSGIFTSSQSILVSNSGTGTLNWIVSSNQNWLECTPGSGIDSGVIDVSVNISGLTTGTYSGAVTISSANASNSPQTVNVTLRVYNSTEGPFGVFSTPIDGSTVSSSIPVTGWVLDDIEVQSVKIYREAGSALEYIGDAVFVEGARPDVELSYPSYPLNYRAGWGYMLLTNFLPNNGNGTFTLHAIAKDKEGNEVSLGTKTINVDNANAVKPFGAIDTPGQGGIATGNSFTNWGWALTPQPNTIPTDGSTINVYVDGINLGHPTYNTYRKDIATLFPGYNNSNGAVGYFYLDTTGYENGVHTIQWTATDNAGNTDGIGSRYFLIQNVSASRVKGARNSFTGEDIHRAIFRKKLFKHVLLDIIVPDSSPVELKNGYKQKFYQQIKPDKKGVIAINCTEVQPLAVRLASGSTPVYGYMIKGKKLNPLPVGSTLKEGIFYWTPGVAFFGDYRLLFIIKGKKGIFHKRELVVKINPKFPKK